MTDDTVKGEGGAKDFAAIMNAAQVLMEAPEHQRQRGLDRLADQISPAFALEVERMLPPVGHRKAVTKAPAVRPLPQPPPWAKAPHEAVSRASPASPSSAPMVEPPPDPALSPFGQDRAEVAADVVVPTAPTMSLWDRQMAELKAKAEAKAKAQLVTLEALESVPSAPPAKSVALPKAEAAKIIKSIVVGSSALRGGLRREITLPLAAAASEQVHLLNQKHHVIGNYGGKCMVLSWERWDVNPQEMVPTFQTFGDFQNRYKNRYVKKQTDDGETNTPAGKFWLSATARTTYDKVAFEPGEPEVLDGNRLNLWQGFAVQPRKGSWKLLRNHIYRVLGNGDRQAGRYIIRWLAWALQNPGLPAEAVVAFQGYEGSGKGTLARVFLQIFGSASLPISDPHMLAGQFSGHLQHCCFLFVDEAFWAGDVKAEGRLKSLITEPTITIRPMYVQGFQVRNMLHIMMASNNDWVVPAGHGSRRYAVFKVSDTKVEDFPYFDRLNAEIDGGGTEAMLYDLLRLRLGGWHPKKIYETTALVEQKGHSLRGLDAWIEAMLQEGTLPKPVLTYANRCLTEDLREAAKQFDRYTNDSAIAGKLKKVFGEDAMKPFNNKVKRGWAFPPLPDCREAWERRNGGRWTWHRPADEWGRGGFAS